MNYVDFIEKVVILDILLDNLVNDNFVKNKSFPFMPKELYGFES